MNSLSIAVSISVACYDLWSNCHWFLHFVSGQREGGRETKRLSLFMIFTYIYKYKYIFCTFFQNIKLRSWKKTHFCLFMSPDFVLICICIIEFVLFFMLLILFCFVYFLSVFDLLLDVVFFLLENQKFICFSFENDDYFVCS